MTFDEAVKIVQLAEKARLSIATNGEIPADWVAREYDVSRGEGVSLIFQARDILAKGEPCDHCSGTGRKQRSAISIPTIQMTR